MIMKDANNDTYEDLTVSADGKNLSFGGMDYTGQVQIFYLGASGVNALLVLMLILHSMAPCQRIILEQGS